ncbi:4Fe-4S binding protein [Leadbettera azotonutricia]|uniref:4Fe-4S binding protein n=1 Tax=Leadbettera azotonutricia TaxID=150829 RepID=UPI001C07A49D|nr:4Fe-4S binding protein [Leadbettera azotonutricia]
MKGQIIAASCPATESLIGILLSCSNDAGAVVLKTASSTRLNQNETEGGRHCLINKQGFWAKSTFNREIMSLNEELELLTQISRIPSFGFVPFIASVTELEMDIEKWLADCRAVENAGADAIQLDLFYIENLLAVSDFEEKFISLLKEILSHTKVPVMPKLNIGLPAEYAAFLLKKAGIKYVSLLDSIKSPAPLSFSPEGQPAVNKTLLGSGLSVFGSFMLPITRNYTQVLCREGFEVCAGGGVKTAEDIADLLFLGAKTVQIATEILLHGFKRIKTLTDETSALLKKAGITDEESIKTTGQNLYNPLPKSAKYHAQWNIEKCMLKKHPEDCFHCSYNHGHANGQAFCPCINYGGLKTIAIHESCEGCGLCAQLCPHGAIEMTRID